MTHGALGILVGVSVWSFLWFSLNKLLPWIFSGQFKPDGTTDHFVINLIIVLLSFDFSFIAGYINATITRAHKKRFAFIQGIIQLIIGIFIQRRYWGIVPLWFHVSFLSFIIPAVVAGAVYKVISKKG
ncbi:MAG TPA: hypothetical protein VI749_05845 [Candidatus Omnitrophota bacterium]|nr:hypothetical protein [Candidatus Omnitrophota bacterium]